MVVETGQPITLQLNVPACRFALDIKGKTHAAPLTLRTLNTCVHIQMHIACILALLEQTHVQFSYVLLYKFIKEIILLDCWLCTCMYVFYISSIVSIRPSSGDAVWS